MTNSTACVVTGNCTILDGSSTNGTFFVSGSNGYDPDAPVPLWHQHMELATICVADTLILVIILARTWYRWNKLKRLRSDDRWMLAAGLFVTFYFICQLGSVRNGSGLHIQNVKKKWLEGHWRWMIGWYAYYVANTCIKISVCCCFIEILPIHFKSLRYWVYGVSVFIGSLGVTLTCAWLFSCTPFLSNFRWSVESTSCVNLDIFRWLWIAGSLAIDCLLLFTPLRILKRSNIQGRERRILELVFCATFLGTIVCACGIYGAYEVRTAAVYDLTYLETSFVMMNNIELFMYTLGASVPVLSRYFMERAGPNPPSNHSNFSSWARNVPNFFSTRQSQTMATTQGEDQSKHISTLKSHRSNADDYTATEVQEISPNCSKSQQLPGDDVEKGRMGSVETQESPSSQVGLISQDLGR